MKNKKTWSERIKINLYRGADTKRNKERKQKGARFSFFFLPMNLRSHNKQSSTLEISSIMPKDHPKKTSGKKGIKRQKTPNKLTSKTPREPGSSSTTKKNAPEVPLNPSSPSESFSSTLPSDAFQFEPSDNDSPSPPSDGDESNDAPIELPGPMTRSKTKKLDELWRKQIEKDSKWADSIELPKLLERRVPVKPSCPSDSDSDTSEPFSWNPFEVSFLEYKPYVNSPSPPSDGVQ
ncbi:hypothetical protein QL285_028748 [Trifolium repens]|nr:hypothetical protein QL285_028748 [Trifolium repens]